MKPLRQKKFDRLMNPGATSAELRCDYAVAPFDRVALDMERTCEVDGCTNPKYLRGYCNAHYIRLRRHGSPTAGATAKRAPIAWLRSLIENAPDECVPWPFASNGNGYGWAWHEGKRIGAHRLSLSLSTGGEVAGMVAAHLCHNRCCVNPKHLVWATQQENVLQERDHKNGFGKLRPEQAREIKASDRSCKALAEAYGVSLSTVYKIKSGDVWNGL